MIDLKVTAILKWTIGGFGLLLELYLEESATKGAPRLFS